MNLTREELSAILESLPFVTGAKVELLTALVRVSSDAMLPAVARAVLFESRVQSRFVSRIR